MDRSGERYVHPVQAEAGKRSCSAPWRTDQALTHGKRSCCNPDEGPLAAAAGVAGLLAAAVAGGLEPGSQVWGVPSPAAPGRLTLAGSLASGQPAGYRWPAAGESALPVVILICHS